MDIQTKDGILLRGIPEGTPDDVIKARINKIRAETAAPAASPLSPVDQIPTGGVKAPEAVTQRRPLPIEIARQVGLTARHGLEGVGGALDFLATPFRAAVNVALPKRMQAKPGVGEDISNLFGLPAPEGAQERVVGDIARTMAGGAAFGGAAKAAAPGVTGVTRAILQRLAESPGAQAFASAGAGAGSGLARESGAGPTGQFIAGLAGGMGAASGPAMVGGVKRAGNLIDQFLPGGETRAAGRIASTIAGEQAPDIARALSQASRVETAKQAATSTPSREFPALMKIAEQNAPTPIGVRLEQQAARRAEALETVKPDLAAAQKARSAASEKNYKEAYDEIIKADPRLMEMARNPFFKKAMQEVSDLAEAKNITPKTNLTEYLQYVKIGLDKALRRTGDTALAAEEKKAVTDLQKDLVGWIGEKNPKYEFARAEHQRLSRPIEQSKVINAIEETMRGVAGGERVAPLMRALDVGEEAIVKRATGFKKDELENILTPRQMKVINAIESQMEKQVLAERYAREGSKKASEIFSAQETPITLPNVLSRPVSVANAIMKRAEGYGSQKMLDELSRLNLNPREFAEVIKNATPQQKRALIDGMLTQRLMIGGISQQVTQGGQ